MRALPLLLGLLLPLLFACSSPPASKPTPPPAPDAPAVGAAAPGAPAAAAPAAAVDIPAFCRATMAGQNPAQCYGKDARSESIKTSFCIDTLRTPLRAGKVTVDAARLAACQSAAVAALPSLPNQRSVTDLAERFPECRDVFTGTLAAGAECVGAMECAPGLVCHAMKCAPPAQLDEPCVPVIELTMTTIDSVCADGLYCSIRDRACKPRVAAGGACVLSDQCAAGLVCRGAKCTSRPAAPPKTGDECDDSATDCPAGDFCNLSHRCEKLRADGESCLSNSQCQNQCVSDADSVSGKCGPCT